MDAALLPGAGAQGLDSDAMEARARTVREARARASEMVKRRRLAARDGAPADAAP